MTIFPFIHHFLFIAFIIWCTSTVLYLFVGWLVYLSLSSPTRIKVIVHPNISLHKSSDFSVTITLYHILITFIIII